jgi:hypothetical protein
LVLFAKKQPRRGLISPAIGLLLLTAAGFCGGTLSAQESVSAQESASAEELELIQAATAVASGLARDLRQQQPVNPLGRKRYLFGLDRQAFALMSVQAAAELYDGATTRNFVNHCKTCVEADPASRLLLGPRPTWKSMLAMGSLEVVATTFVSQTIRSSSNGFLRRAAPWLQFAISAVHIGESTRNMVLMPPVRSRRIQPRR